jgi:8-oxo-dGTP pyrophosphatase MutT (NUDIX family)
MRNGEFGNKKNFASLTYFLYSTFDIPHSSFMRLPVWRPLYHSLKAFGAPVEWEISVGAAVFRVDGGERRYLILRYPSGHFDFPKGHMEKGETEEGTLRRETEEETGICTLRILPRRTSIRYFYVAKGSERERRIREGRGFWIFKAVHFYPAETDESDVKISHEHTGFEWLPYEAALEKLTFENAKEVLRRAEWCVRKEDASGL